MQFGDGTRSTDTVEQLDFQSPAQSDNVAQQQPAVPEPSEVKALATATPAMPTPMREPVYIAGTGKKSAGTMLPPKGRRSVIHAGVAIVLIAIVIGTLVAVIPTGSSEAFGLGNIFRPSTGMVTSKQNSTALIASQAATATAVTVDGYEYDGAGGNQSWAGVQNNFALPDGTTTQQVSSQAPTYGGSAGGISSSTGTIANAGFNDYFTAGQCTYWADYEYHRLTGYAVTWSGNASYWAIGAAGAGWTVSSAPKVYSIIVLQPGTQGAGADGHVGVVEGINSDGSVRTTNWNVVGWGQFSWETYTPGPGVQFIWHP
jgi:surface antigen